MALSTPEEARQSERKRVLKGGKIAFAARCASLPCVVRDISDTGARLQVKDHSSVPETFELLIELDGFEADVEVVWRRTGEVGVVFLDEPKIKNPVRRQIVSSSVPKNRGTLRRVKAPSARRDLTDIQHDANAEIEIEVKTDDAPFVHNNMAEAVDAQVNALNNSLGTLELAAGDDVAVSDDTADAVLSTVDEKVDTPVLDPTETVKNPADYSEQGLSEDLSDASHTASDLAELDEYNEEDAFLMDQSIVTPQDTRNMDENSDIAPPTEDHVQETDPTFRQEAPHVEAPVFRDQVLDYQQTVTLTFASDTSATIPVDDQAVTTADPVIVAASETTLEETKNDARGMVETESTSSFVDPMTARITTALQASNRAAENLIKPVVPIIPAPVEVTQILDAEPTAPDTNMVVTSNEVSHGVGNLVVSENEIAADKTTAAATAEPLIDIAGTKDTTPSDNVEPDTTPTPELRQDLADFVQMFAASSPAMQITADDLTSPATDDTDENQSTSSEITFDAEPDFVDLATTPDCSGVEAPIAATSNIFDFPPTSEPFAHAPSEPSESAPLSSRDFTIVEESIIVDDEISTAVPNFCEMMVGEPAADSVEPIVSAVIAPELYDELLPCADEDDFVASETEYMTIEPSLEIDVPQMTEVALPEIMSAPTPQAERGVAPCDEESAVVGPGPSHDIPILIAEDDADDRMFMREAFGDSDFKHEIDFVENGQELLDYLNGIGEYADRPRPGLILLDLNMPKMDGRTALLHIKSNPSLRRIPVIVLTTSNSEDDIEKTYDLGVSSYISKPSSAEGLKDVITTLNGYWSTMVALPSRH